MHKMSCGHYSHTVKNECSKCKYFSALSNDPKFDKYRAGLQYSGTPWILVLGEKKDK